MTQVAPAAAPVETTRVVKKRKPKTVDTKNLMFLVDAKGVLALSKDPVKKKVKPLGFIDPTELVKAISKDIPINTGLLPNECKLMEVYKNYTFALYEFAPTIVNVNYLGRGSDKAITTYELSLPYTIFLISMKSVSGKTVINSSGCFAFARQHPIDSLDSQLMKLPLNNVWDDGRICFGNDSGGFKERSSIAITGKGVCNMFFTLNFNGDIQPSPVAALHPYSNWAASTKLDPSFILDETKVPLNKSYYTVGSLLDHARSTVSA